MSDPVMVAEQVRRALDGVPGALACAAPEELYALLMELHQARVELQADEERVLLAANTHGLSLRRLARALEVSSPDTVAHRLRRIRRTQDPAGTVSTSLRQFSALPISTTLETERNT